MPHKQNIGLGNTHSHTHMHIYFEFDEIDKAITCRCDAQFNPISPYHACIYIPNNSVDISAYLCIIIQSKERFSVHRLNRIQQIQPLQTRTRNKQINE